LLSPIITSFIDPINAFGQLDIGTNTKSMSWGMSLSEFLRQVESRCYHQVSSQ